MRGPPRVKRVPADDACELVSADCIGAVIQIKERKAVRNRRRRPGLATTPVPMTELRAIAAHASANRDGIHTQMSDEPTDQGGIFGKLPDSRPGTRSPRRASAAKATPRRRRSPGPARAPKRKARRDPEAGAAAPKTRAAAPASSPTRPPPSQQARRPRRHRLGRDRGRGRGGDDRRPAREPRDRGRAGKPGERLSSSAARAAVSSSVEALSARFLGTRLPREHHRARGDGRLQPGAGALPVRPPGPLRLRQGDPEPRRRGERAARPAEPLPGRRAELARPTSSTGSATARRRSGSSPRSARSGSARRSGERWTPPSAASTTWSAAAGSSRSASRC